MVNQNTPQHSTTISVSKGFGMIPNSLKQRRQSHPSLSLDEVRTILNKSLKGKELFEYTRQERNET